VALVRFGSAFSALTKPTKPTALHHH
jgi:hypothetical protein